MPLAGEYESPAQWAKIEVADGWLVGNISSQPVTLTPVAGSPVSTFLANSRVMNSLPVEFKRDAAGQAVAFTVSGQKFTRSEEGDGTVFPETKIGTFPTADVPPLWSQYVGVYGPSFIPLVISIRHGHLYALVENELDYRLTPASRHVFVCPLGMYRLEHLVFLTDAQGKVHGVNFANMYLPRHGAGNGETKGKQ